MISALLLSGGMDSAAIAYWKRPSIAITINYGQLPAAGEIRAASQICRELDIRHEIIDVNCRALGSGDMAGTAKAAAAPVSEWWPFRNQLLVTLAAMRGIALGVSELLVGSIASDDLHVDGTEPFYKRLDDLVALQEGHIRVRAPAIQMSGGDLIRASQVPLELLAWSHSCHVANFSCGFCRGCQKHQQVLAELGNHSF